MHRVRWSDAGRQFHRGPAGRSHPADSRALRALAKPVAALASGQTSARPEATLATERNATGPGPPSSRKSPRPAARRCPEGTWYWIFRQPGPSSDPPMATGPEHRAAGHRGTGCSGFARPLQDQARRLFDRCVGFDYPHPSQPSASRYAGAGFKKPISKSNSMSPLMQTCFCIPLAMLSLISLPEFNL